MILFHLCDPLLFSLQGKKSKKKAKQAAKETKPAAVDGKEPEEGKTSRLIGNFGFNSRF